MALAKLHAFRQAPQLATSVAVEVSQPSCGSPLQLSKPGAQTGEHKAGAEALALIQDVEPCALVQRKPQAPQLAVLWVRSVSHPSFKLMLLQSPQPESQVIPHLPALQEAVPLVELHLYRHAPQFDVSALVFTSQPLLATPSQSIRPGMAQLASPQTLLLQTWPLAHAVPHLPQLAALEVKSTSQPSV